MSNLFEVFSDNSTRSVFSTLVSKKRADMRSLRQDLSLPVDQVQAALERLVDVGLVEQVKGALPDFNIYFPSAAGLAANRKLNTAGR